MRSPLSLPFSRLNRPSSSLSWRSGLTLRSNLAGGMSWQRLPGIKQTHTQKSALRREIPWNFTGWGFKDSVAVLWQEMLEEQQANDEWAAQPYSDRGWFCTGNIKKNVTVDWMKWLFPSVCLQEALYCETGVCPVEAFKGAGEQGTFCGRLKGLALFHLEKGRTIGNIAVFSLLRGVCRGDGSRLPSGMHKEKTEG